jgi:hypothetical protein
MEALEKESPLIHWLIPKVPLLLQSAGLSVLIIWITKVFALELQPVLNLMVPLFVVLTVLSAYAPKILKGFQYGIGFALSVYIFHFKIKDNLNKK